MAWNPTRVGREEKGTGEILLGMADGSIWEVDIDRTEKYAKQIQRFSSDPVTGLRIEEMRLRSKGGSDTLRKFFVMITTPRREYQFIGTTDLAEAPIFHAVLNNKDNMRSSSWEGGVILYDYSSPFFFTSCGCRPPPAPRTNGQQRAGVFCAVPEPAHHLCLAHRLRHLLRPPRLCPPGMEWRRRGGVGEL